MPEQPRTRTMHFQRQPKILVLRKEEFKQLLTEGDRAQHLEDMAPVTEIC